MVVILIATIAILAMLYRFCLSLTTNRTAPGPLSIVQQGVTQTAERFCEQVIGCKGTITELECVSGTALVGRPSSYEVNCSTAMGDVMMTMNKAGEVVSASYLNDPTVRPQSVKSLTNGRVTSSEAIWMGKRCLATLNLRGQSFQVKRVMWDQGILWELVCRCQEPDLIWKDCRIQIDADTGRLEYCHVGKAGAFARQSSPSQKTP